MNVELVVRKPIYSTDLAVGGKWDVKDVIGRTVERVLSIMKRPRCQKKGALFTNDMVTENLSPTSFPNYVTAKTLSSPIFLTT